MMCVKAEIDRASDTEEEKNLKLGGRIQRPSSKNKHTHTCLAQELSYSSRCANCSSDFCPFKIRNVVREFEMLRKELGDFAAFISPKLFVLKGARDIGNAQGSTSQENECRSTVGFRLLT